MNSQTAYTVVLQDGTVGQIEKSAFMDATAYDFIGHEVNVSLHDENGMPIKRIGTMVEVIQEPQV